MADFYGELFPSDEEEENASGQKIQEQNQSFEIDTSALPQTQLLDSNTQQSDIENEDIQQAKETAEPPPAEKIEPPVDENTENTETKASIEELFGAASDEENPPEGETMTDLFGDFSDEEVPTEGPQAATQHHTQQHEEVSHFAEPPTSTPKRKTAYVKRLHPDGPPEALKLNTFSKPEGKVYTIKVPNIVGLEPDNFDEKTYVAPKATDKTSFIRWRIFYDAKDPHQPFKESNARLVTWNDDSKSLVIGSEVFDIEETPFKESTHFLYSDCQQAQINTPDDLYRCQGPINCNYRIKSEHVKGAGAVFSQAAIASKFRKLTKAGRISLGQKLAMQKDIGAKRGIDDAKAQANRKRKRQRQRMLPEKRQKMDEDFLERGAQEINVDDMGDDTDEDTRLYTSLSKTQKLSNLVGNTQSIVQHDDDESDSDEPLNRVSQSRGNPNSKIVEDSDSDN